MSQTTLTAEGVHAAPARHAFHPAPVPLSVAAGSGEEARRILNVAFAGLLLMLTAPLMLLIALLVKMSSPGPVLYTQTRVGVDRRNGRPPEPHVRRHFDHGGRLFRIYKFRTMYVNGATAPQVWAQPDDPRVTPVGRILRSYRLDELPQLLNVLKGDMNLVGPRPEQPQIFVRLRDDIAHYAGRQRILPGITGWAQVNLHYGVTVDDTRAKLRFDLDYLRRRSALEDLRILVLTVPVVVFRRGAW